VAGRGVAVVVGVAAVGALGARFAGKEEGRPEKDAEGEARPPESVEHLQKRV